MVSSKQACHDQGVLVNNEADREIYDVNGTNRMSGPRYSFVLMPADQKILTWFRQLSTKSLLRLVAVNDRLYAAHGWGEDLLNAQKQIAERASRQVGLAAICRVSDEATSDSVYRDGQMVSESGYWNETELSGPDVDSEQVGNAIFSGLGIVSVSLPPILDWMGPIECLKGKEGNRDSIIRQMRALDRLVHSNQKVHLRELLQQLRVVAGDSLETFSLTRLQLYTSAMMTTMTLCNDRENC